MMKKYRFERKGRRSFDTALEYDPAGMMVSERTLVMQQQQFWVGVAFTAGFVCFLMYSISKGRNLNSGQRVMLRILSAICAAIGGALISGDAFVDLSRKIPGGQFTISGTAGFAIFFVIWFTFPQPLKPDPSAERLRYERDQIALHQPRIPLVDPVVLVRCPKCGTEQRSTPFNRASLQEMLNAGKDVPATGTICSHTWSLTAQEREGIRKALQEGTL